MLQTVDDHQVGVNDIKVTVGDIRDVMKLLECTVNPEKPFGRCCYTHVIQLNKQVELLKRANKRASLRSGNTKT